MPARIVEWQLPYTWGTGIDIDTNKVISLLLREENNLIMVNEDNEVYTDLQLQSGLTPNSDFPVWVTVWKILQADWWTKSGLLLNWKTTSGDYARWIYANDWNIYFDWGTGTWKQVYYSSQVDELLTNLRNEVYEYFIRYSDFYWVTKTGSQFNLELSTEITPEEDFVVDVPTEIEEGQIYVLRVNNWSTSYVMTLGNNITNPKNTSIALNPSTTDTFVFLAVDDTHLELQPIVDQASMVNDWTLTIQKNGTTVGTFSANQATNDTVNIEVPVAVDDLTSTSTTQPLSANQGRELKSLIDDLAGFWKFLSLWNSTTWMPISLPLATPYSYSTGDYFVVEVVWATNYRPNGSSYTGTASTIAETDEIEVWDVYVYDWSVWLLQSNHGKTVTFGNIAGSPYDNTNLSNALNDKQDVLTAGSNITIDPSTNTISANNTTYSSATSTTAGIVKLWDDTVQTDTMNSPSATTWKTYPVQVNASGQMSVNVPWSNTTYSSLPASQWWTAVSLVTTGEKYEWDNKQDELTAWTNVQISNNVISATDTTYNAWPGINIGTYNDYSAMRWPAPSGYHIPSKDEWGALYDAGVSLWIWTSSSWTPVKTYLKMPFAGYRGYSSAGVDSQDTYARYWSSTRYSDSNANSFDASSAVLNAQYRHYRANGFSVRCFKNYPVTPNGSWTTLYQWTWSAGIFRSPSLWLISISSDGTNRITIQDKNLWATTVYNDWDTLSEANCGKYYQRWNNYWFAWTGSVTTSSTKVDASTYWPWNYYSSSTFITVSESPYAWDTTDNGNLWWWETGVVTVNDAITNTWVLSVNWMTGDVAVNEGITKIFTLSSTSDLTTAQAAFDRLALGNISSIRVGDNLQIYQPFGTGYSGTSFSGNISFSGRGLNWNSSSLMITGVLVGGYNFVVSNWIVTAVQALTTLALMVVSSLPTTPESNTIYFIS